MPPICSCRHAYYDHMERGWNQGCLSEGCPCRFFNYAAAENE